MRMTFLKKSSEMPSRSLEHCHGGTGSIDWLGVLSGEEPGGRRVRFIHDDVLPSGSSIGVHRHAADQEYYYIVSGRGVMTLDGQEHQVAAGDIAAVLPGGSHGLRNDFDEDLRIIVIGVAAEGGQP